MTDMLCNSATSYVERDTVLFKNASDRE